MHSTLRKLFLPDNTKQCKKTLTQQEAAAGTAEPLLNSPCQQLKRFWSNKYLGHFPGSQHNWDGTAAADLPQPSEGRKLRLGSGFSQHSSWNHGTGMEI